MPDAAAVLGTIAQLARRLLVSVFGAESWDAWLVLLHAVFGLPLSDRDLEVFTLLTGRTFAPSSAGIRIREAWFIVGRRAGKSMIAALIAVYLTTCRVYELAPGERGVFMVIAADRRQARVVKRYISGLLRAVPVLRQQLAKETRDAIELTNGLQIEIHTASFRTLRGYTVVGAVCDEIAFWPTDDSANPDTEILAALRPAMATVSGALLLCLTSPYARRGETWKAWREHYGQDRDAILVVKASTRALNPLVPQEVIDDAYAADPAHAAAEYGAEFRSDIETLFTREALEAVVATGRRQLPPLPSVTYRAFVDPSGGSADSMTLAIAHQEADRTLVLDTLVERRPPFSPESVVTEFAALLKTYRVTRVMGDRYGGEWPRERFRTHGIQYDLAPQSRSELYLALLPLVNSGLVALLDEPRLMNQLASLERRTARGGKDSIDHAPGSHDDAANACAGVLTMGTGVEFRVW